MESDVFYGAIKTNDHFYDFEPYSESKETCWKLSDGFELIMLLKHTVWVSA